MFACPPHAHRSQKKVLAPLELEFHSGSVTMWCHLLTQVLQEQSVLLTISHLFSPVTLVEDHI